MFSDVEEKVKKKRKILFTRESESLQELNNLLNSKDKKHIISWCLDCASYTLNEFESKYPEELRPRICLDVCKKWVRGEIKMPVAKRAILDSHAVAKTINDPEYGAYCHAIGHAGASIHVKSHAIGLAMYELTGIVIKHNYRNYEKEVLAKINFYIDKLYRTMKL